MVEVVNGCFTEGCFENIMTLIVFMNYDVYPVMFCIIGYLEIHKFNILPFDLYELCISKLDLQTGYFVMSIMVIQYEIDEYLDYL